MHPFIAHEALPSSAVWSAGDESEPSLSARTMGINGFAIDHYDLQKLDYIRGTYSVPDVEQ